MQTRREFKAGLAASIAIHALALVWLLSIATAPIRNVEDPMVSITLVAPPSASESETPLQAPKETPASPQPAPTTAPAQQEAPPSNPQAEDAPAQERLPPPAPPTDTGPKMIEAQAFYASAILARPENRSARDALKTLSPEERNEQICDTEAMEQVRRADAKFRPDRLIAYALENTQVEGDRLHAPGAAFRSAHRWFRLSFDCTLDAKRSTVTAFRFSIGDPIPSSRWGDLQLER